MFLMDKRKSNLPNSHHRTSDDRGSLKQPADHSAVPHGSSRPNRRDYRVLLKPTKHKRARTTEKTVATDDRVRSDDVHGEPQDGAARVSLPLKSTRLGPIFGNMRVSDRMRRDKAEHVLGKKGDVPSRPCPFFQSASFPKLPERVQRFLQEPTLVSFSNTSEKDELAWLDKDTTCDGGVSERRNPALSEEANKSRRGEAQTARSAKDYVYSNRSVASAHPSQQSSQTKRRPFSGIKDRSSGANNYTEPNESRGKMVTRGTSPILALPLRSRRQSYSHGRHSVMYDEAVQTNESDSQSQHGSAGSLARSIAIQFVSTPSGSGNVSPMDVVYSPSSQKVTPITPAKTSGSLRASAVAGSEKVLLDTGEVALLIRGPVQITPLPESRNEGKLQRESRMEAKRKNVRPRESTAEPRKKRPHANANSEKLLSKDPVKNVESAFLDTTTGFNFNPKPMFRPVTAQAGERFFEGLGVTNEVSHSSNIFKNTQQRHTADSVAFGGPHSDSIAGFALNNDESGRSGTYPSLLHVDYDEADKIAAEYRALREETQSRRSIFERGSVIRRAEQEIRPENKDATEPLRRGAISRVYPRKMF